MTAFLASVIVVVIAEMGDKTQLLAMCMAARYKWQTVMWGVFVATLANHLLAALAGTYVTRVVPMSYVNVAAAVAFIIFGLWTIKGDDLDCEDKKSEMSPFWTVAVAFFLAEMGDKTQLAAITLAAKYNSMMAVWLGTTLGMMIADAFGIIVGVVMGKSIPEKIVKWIAALIFILYGLYSLYISIL
ncbi:TMEM165/GDT1 family protein [Candidatus Magnetomonas plexicatena]|uniref:TMEM165/GDT1 family protein n=1 Tax=Candidatus Magnetomonas plexicatena TaxID=2552947 RepID=UPI0011049DD6|nr:TMEM165/GDT1 family protein [Nitrospirales bacterium LBB_01]